MEPPGCIAEAAIPPSDSNPTRTDSGLSGDSEADVISDAELPEESNVKAANLPDFDDHPSKLAGFGCRLCTKSASSSSSRNSK